MYVASRLLRFVVAFFAKFRRILLVFFRGYSSVGALGVRKGLDPARGLGVNKRDAVKCLASELAGVGRFCFACQVGHGLWGQVVKNIRRRTEERLIASRLTLVRILISRIFMTSKELAKQP